MTLGPIGQKIAAKLTDQLKPLSLEVIDESHQHHGHAGAHPSGESHFRVRIVSRDFSGKMRVARHRMVNEVLAEELRSRVHALAIEAIAPEEDLSFIALEDDDARLQDLLSACGLPSDDLLGKLFVGMARGDGSLIAAGGIDLAPPFALLRSVAVQPDLKGQGFGRVMAIKMLGEARNAGAREVYLLTTSAVRFFAQFGFEPVTRDEVPADITNTSQFRGSTCASAQAMRLRLQPIG